MVISFNDERSRWTITPAALAQIAAALPADWELAQVSAPVSSRGDGTGISREAISAIRGAEVYAGMGFPRELFESADCLRWVHTGAAGVASLLYAEMVESDVVLTNSAGVHAAPMAETVIGAVLYFARGFDFATSGKQSGAWDQSRFDSDASPVREITGAVMGILGYGGIGRAVARRARALGMDVVATRQTGPQSDEHAEVIAADQAGLQRLLSESDYIVVALPATAATRGLVGARQLALVKPAAVVINVARGNVIVEADLIEALQNHRLRGAALDVFEREPLPENSPLWALPNTLILPHISATTPRFWEREADLITENLKRYLEDRPLRNVVDKAAGY